MSLENDVVGWMLGSVDFVLFVELAKWIQLDLENKQVQQPGLNFFSVLYAIQTLSRVQFLSVNVSN